LKFTNKNDPRIILRDKLIDNGLLPKYANLIAVEAGGSQTYVDFEYLKELGLSETHLMIALKLVSDFYFGIIVTE
jgi:hypothetical protein